MEQQLADERGRYAAVLAATRVFAVVILAPSVAFSFNYGIMLNTVLLSAVWMVAIFADSIRRVPLMPALVVEASLVTFLVALSLSESTVLLPALVIPLFIGGLVRGVIGAVQVMGAELAVLGSTILPNAQVQLDQGLALVLFTWIMLGLGFGLIAATVHKMKLEGDETTSYRDARELITQLLELSDSLVEGLDPVSIGQNIVDLAREEIPLSGVLVHVRTPDGGIAILEGEAAPAPAPDRDALVMEAFERGHALHRAEAVAIPVRTEASVVAVLSAGLAPGYDPDEIGIREALSAVAKVVRPEALKLDTALLFTAVRESATTEERQRLAREMHDGIAQDLASFGYLIDDVAATADSPEQAARVAALRSELSNVVADLRRSVFSLRNEAVDKRPLGESIRALAQHIQDRSGIAVDVTVEDGTTRLLPAVEAELLRIAQEGMNNAVKHAAASRIVVTSKVVAPYAAVTVQDDGVGLGPGRDDSHGIRIMRERARRIGGILELTDTGHGALLRVYIAPAGNGRDSESLLEGSMQP